MGTYSAVVTTGIYCRPGCGAQPRPENVRKFPVPAAAEVAGYRACLRCRPYRTSQPVGWSGPELVCRAVRMILDGVLDENTEQGLGARLGVSARHLRRLFVAHLGATPDELARSSRAHFARRLLDDTDLTVTEIAFAAGYGSVRQLNRSCQSVFRATPSQLRAKRRAADRLVADGGLLLRLSFQGDLDWEQTAAYLAAHAIPGVEHVDGATYRRTVTIDGDPGVLELLPGGAQHLMLRAHLPHWAGLIHIVNRARRIAALDEDMDEPLIRLAADPVIGPLVAVRPGIRVPGTWDPFETGVLAIIGQQESPAEAAAIAGRIARQHGTQVPGLGQLRLSHTFPSPQALAAADLTASGLTRLRAAAVSSFAAAVAGRQIRLDRSVSLDHLVGAVAAIEGVGPAAAHALAWRMGEPDACPTAGLVAPDQVSERWRPWRALAIAQLRAADRAGQSPWRLPPAGDLNGQAAADRDVPGMHQKPVHRRAAALQ